MSRRQRRRRMRDRWLFWRHRDLVRAAALVGLTPAPFERWAFFDARIRYFLLSAARRDRNYL